MAQKRDFFNESASSSARDARQYLTDSAFASLINSLPTRVFPMPIGPAVAELSSRDGTHVCPILTFLTISPATFPMLKQRGNRRFSSSCHAPVLHPSDPVSRREIVLNSFPTACANFSRLRPTVRAGRDAKGPPTQKSNTHTHRRT